MIVDDEEIFDVVDTDDLVTGRAARSEVHARGLRHRAVHILVFNELGELYVQRRSLDKDCSPGLWDTSAAGHVASGEAYAAAAQRELHEELGLPLGTVLDPLFKLQASAATGFEFVRVFRCITGAQPIPDPEEIMEARWIANDELARWLRRASADFTGTFREICARLRFSV